MFSLIRPYIFTLDPETAHNLAIKSLKFNFLPQNIFAVENEEILKTTLFGKDINNPIGLAAGFDKNAEVYNEILNLGFGFTEVGTVTPKKQYGNQKPRVFRLKRDNALINRLGFNNDGSDIIKKRIENNIPNGVLGINIGPNKNTDNMINDFVECADYAMWLYAMLRKENAYKYYFKMIENQIMDENEFSKTYQIEL